METATAWLDQVYREALAPEPSLLVSEWADRHRVLPPTSAEPGQWRTDRVPYLRGIMDALSTGSPYERVVLMKSAQAGGTEIGLNWLAYIIAHAPGLALLVQPSLDMARRNTRTRLDPMIESTPALRERVSAPRSRNAYNSAFTKSFPGGVLVATGANSAAALRSTPCRYLMLDEVDGYPADVDNEGDPVGAGDRENANVQGPAADFHGVDANRGRCVADREGVSRRRSASVRNCLHPLRQPGADRMDEYPLAGRAARACAFGLRSLQRHNARA
jgi:phage terminase large subunit GpA-like protein